MSTNDKTGERLVDSMRKTKAAASGDAPDAPAAKRKTATRKKSAGSTRSRAKKTQESPSEASRDPYQAGRRVWPD